MLLTAGLYTPARAQDPDDMQRGVARISLMNGEVSVRRGDSGDWVAGIINAPLLSDDRISTAPNSRAEIQFDAANILRIGGNAEVRLTQLTQLAGGRYQMEIARGTVTFRVLRSSDANVEVDTPSVSVRPSKQGVYRIMVNDAGETQMIARAGEVEVFTPRGSQWVTQGQMMVARGTTADPEFQIVNANPPDEWDRWNDNRDRALMQSTSSQYVGPGVYGAEDLDQYGTWQDVAPYGPVWRPTAVGADWAPYQSGQWAWEDWYGWTWVSYDPWGWAPYHYGRWFNQPGFGWCWYPGLRGFRSYWSPALVGFFGFGGGGFGVGFGFGNIGWVPLAPFEVFHPWWGRGFYGRGFGNFNVTNVNVSNIYRNARVANGISGVSAADFRAGRFNNISRVPGSQVASAGLIRGQVPVAPTNANLRYSSRSVTNVPRTNENTRFFTHQQPSAAQRVPFAQQQRSFESGNRGTATPATRSVGQQPGGSSGGWRRFGEPAGQSSAQQNSAQRTTPNTNNRFENTRPPSANGSGWQRFGEPGSATRQGYSGSGNNSTPRYNAPAPRQSTPSYSAPAPRQSAPTYSAPRGGGGGGGGHSSCGGGGHSGGGGSRGHR